jgi:formylglycine-generating enzyme required for sulfatase activity
MRRDAPRSFVPLHSARPARGARHGAALALLALAASGLPSSAVHAQAAAPAPAVPVATRDCPECPEMIRVPAGTFLMGTPGADLANPATRAESQALVVRIPRAFAIGRREVTRAEYRAFIADTQHEVRGACRTWNEQLGRFADDRARTWENPGRPREARDDHPAACVSWDDARAYAQWLARRTGKPYRLPSEAEWEYAARAGSTTLRPWGDAAADGCGLANAYDLAARDMYGLGWEAARCRDGYPDVAPTASLRANAFGLHDMLGNVWEWVEDCATDSYVGRPRDARAWTWIGGCTRRIQRGGSWITPPDRVRSAFRADADARDRADYVGFRVALDLDGRTEAR